MDWRADGILLATRRHGESAAIIEVFTETHGRHAGLVRGGASRRLAPILQPGSQLDVAWRARLDSHLGTCTVEPVRARSAILSDRLALAGLGSLTALATLLPERQPYPALYAETLALLDAIESAGPWPPHYVAWELSLLATLGFGLDLTACAVTGATTGLAHVSPRTGRAVAEGAAGEYADRLLPLPPFLRSDAGDTPITPGHIAEGLRLTGHFLATRLMPAMNRESLPPARDRLARAISRLQL